MKILIDIGHPAHVHYFKNFIRIMNEKGHSCFITARNKEIAFQLLKKYKIPYRSRGKGGGSVFGKILYLPKAVFIIYKWAIIFKPDLFLSFASTYAAYASWLSRKPHIAFDDTEHAKLELLLYPLVTNHILTPDCFNKQLGKKQLLFKSYIEFTYLHSNYFNPEPGIKSELGLTKDDKFILFRFVKWGASHDIGQSGIPDTLKLDLLNLFVNQGYTVFISSEGELQKEFQRYQIKVSPEKIHSVIYEADMFIGESGTMANEAAILGIPSIFVNSLDAGVFQDEVKYKLLYSFRSSTNLLDEIIKLLKIPDLKQLHKTRRVKLVKDKIDVTAFMVWFIENYPKSAKVLKENPDYQNNFK
ncbi:DUF354 domain-containing protein [candidate division KSB1 bacterium]